MLRPLTTPPKRISRYIDGDAYHRAVGAGYTDEIQKFRKYKVGTWRRDPMKLAYGHFIEELRYVPIQDLYLHELDSKGKLDYPKRGHDKEYAERLLRGHEAPPIEVHQLEDGTLKVSDGHRRVLAHKILGRKRIKAWVNYIVGHPEGKLDCEGKIRMTGLTHEIYHGNRVMNNPVYNNPKRRNPTPAEDMVAKLYAALNAGYTVYVSSHTKAWRITKRTADTFAKKGHPIFKASAGSVYMARGKKYDCISGCRITAQKD